MTTYKIFKNKYFLYVMCIFIVIAAWGTLVFHAADNTDGTHFFAVNFIEFTLPRPVQSLSQKGAPRFVAWVQRSEYFTENTFDYFVNNAAVNAGYFLTIILILGQAFKKSFCSNKKTVRYLRI